jgi:hypothetical protein
VNNALTIISLLLQNAQQLQTYGAVLQKALAEGRDVTDEEKASARASLQGHLDGLQSAINTM